MRSSKLEAEPPDIRYQEEPIGDNLSRSSPRREELLACLLAAACKVIWFVRCDSGNSMVKRRTINPDHIRDRNVPAPETEAIAARLQELLSPLVYNQLGYYQQLGLRSRILGLPLMMAAVLTLLWRQVPSVRELSRMLLREDLPRVSGSTGIPTSIIQKISGVSRRIV